MSQKVCTRCGQSKPPEQYYAEKRTRDGRRSECIDCTRRDKAAWFKRNKAAQLARSRAWRERQGPRYSQARRDAAALGTIRRWWIYLEHRGLCHLCAEPVEFERMHLDHITPLVEGGLTEPGNLAPAHPECNWRRRHGYANRHDPIRAGR